jgi:hypothetical protein
MIRTFNYPNNQVFSDTLFARSSSTISYYCWTKSKKAFYLFHFDHNILLIRENNPQNDMINDLYFIAIIIFLCAQFQWKILHNQIKQTLAVQLFSSMSFDIHYILQFYIHSTGYQGYVTEHFKNTMTLTYHALHVSSEATTIIDPMYSKKTASSNTIFWYSPINWCRAHVIKANKVRSKRIWGTMRNKENYNLYPQASLSYIYIYTHIRKFHCTFVCFCYQKITCV